MMNKSRKYASACCSEFFCYRNTVVKLMENDDKGQIIIYQTDNGKINIDVLLEDETVWLT